MSTQPCVPLGSLNRVPASAGVKVKVTSTGWQVTLCNPIWHVIFRSDEVISTNSYFIRLLYDNDKLHVIEIHAEFCNVIAAFSWKFVEPVFSGRSLCLSFKFRDTTCKYMHAIYCPYVQYCLYVRKETPWPATVLTAFSLIIRAIVSSTQEAGIRRRRWRSGIRRDVAT